MKTSISTLALVLLVASISNAREVKPRPISNPVIKENVSFSAFSSFHIHRQKNSASLNWNMTSNDVNFFIIQRSYDGSYFQNIAEVGASASRWNKYLDNTVEPGIIYYRVIALMNNGSMEYSTVESVKIVKH